MKIRLKFQKKGNLKFIGHLDVMRTFQKINRRAGIDIKYSAGFSPHQQMSFSNPLSLGMTSSAEYVDYEMNSVLQFYTFTFSDGGSTLDVIGLDFGEEYIYFWPFG
jgi:radical SAM-linked protein